MLPAKHKMKIQLKLKMNEALFLRNPENSELGKKILKQGIQLIYELGFEAFTFKKLAEAIGTTEAGIYRYFENKHTLLVYLTAWYWGWLEFQVQYHTNNIDDPKAKLEKILTLLVSPYEEDLQSTCLNENLHQVIILEGVKAYLTKQVSEDNKRDFFTPYHNLCSVIATAISEYNPQYNFSKSLATTLIETAHFQIFFMNNLPTLTDVDDIKGESDVISFLKDLTFTCLNKS